MPPSIPCRIALLCALAHAACAETPLAFNDHVRPIFVRHCLACHGGVKQAGGISFVRRETALAEGDSGVAVIRPGDPDASLLLERVIEPDDDFRMPPPEHGRRLSEEEVATLRQWVEQGARWDAPWAFQPPREVAPPEVVKASWPRSPLDRWVLAKLESEGLAPSPPADRAQWLRRVTFDLTGLPPTGEQVDALQDDKRPDARERVVDRLLASEHFGERWASVWLDLARYADTMGFEKDPDRLIWPYRDWVVEALNVDLPYNEFLLKQTAGDLTAGATLADRIATGFHRNSQTNTEGGVDDEEYRWNAVVDRVDTTWQSVLGVSMGCARCHDHPYDPISQQDYYAFAAFLNSTADADLSEDLPKLRVPHDRDRWAEAQGLDERLAELRQKLYQMGVAANAADDDWRGLAFDQAESTGETRLEIRGEGEQTVVAAVGTVTDRSLLNVAAPAPAGRVTAFRVLASPDDPETALATPEMGFVLSRFRVEVERAEAPDASTASAPIKDAPIFSEVFADEADGFFRPIESLADNAAGWGPYTRIRRPRWAVFVLYEPLEVREGDRLRIELKHGKAADGQGPLVIRRLRVEVTGNQRWSDLAASPERRALREQEEALTIERNKIPAAPMPVLAALPDSLRRPTHVFDRGNWLSPKERVEPRTPTALLSAAGDRLAMAEWLGSDDNPLTARVIVNRLWGELFGRAIVETVDDFGSTGAAPSHPELLDYLSIRLRDHHRWRLKGLLREMVLSSTYGQDARATSELVKRDPNNRLLARGPRTRLSAEMVRDQALVLSGKFNPQLGGPPVMPYQPDGVWRSVYNGKQWETDEGDERFRRALYTFWKRTSAYPSMVAFDAPSREQCTARRVTTNTPLQALVTLNDPAFVELADGLADRMSQRQGESLPEQIGWAFREATGQPPNVAAMAELTKLYEEVLGTSGDEAEDRAGFARSVIANVILNLDATLTK